jgi:hypothetical protein
MDETKLEKLARLSGKAASKALGALERRGYDIREKLSAPINRVPRRGPPKPISDELNTGIQVARVFMADPETIYNSLVHLWKFEDDADRRAHWAAVYANKDFVEGFASKFRPLLMTQEVKLLQAAPWGPHPQCLDLGHIIIAEDNDIHGDGVNVAARLEGGFTREEAGQDRSWQLHTLLSRRGRLTLLA